MHIRLESLTKSYQDADRELTVIRDLSFSFPERGSVAIIGRSGIGKSTLMHLLGGLDTPTSGRVLYDGQAISELSSDQRAAFRARKVGFIFQFHHLLPEFSALENVAMPLTIAGVADDSAFEQSAELLARMGLKSRVSHRPSQLSGGEQQRVAIARALVAKPRVVLADEPTGNLDVATAAEVQSIVLELNRELQNTMIVVTHNHELAKSMDVVVEMMPGGELVPVAN
ncbi:MAG: ABC transporter ATP-binding protein [Pseudomonadota bacterium]|jgi:lipoprotein-releasing system ATP-binding protein